MVRCSISNTIREVEVMDNVPSYLATVRWCVCVNNVLFSTVGGDRLQDIVTGMDHRTL